MPKSSIRRLMLARRRSLSQEEFHSASLSIQHIFLETEEYLHARGIVVYASIHKEVDTEEIVRTALESGKKVAFPAVVHHGLVFREVTEISLMKRGAFGIMEPCQTGRSFELDEADIFVLPGIAFDLNGHRIGYGKGYYDKTLHRLEGQGRLVGLCYDFQLVDRIAGEPHDVKMDVIISEKRIVRRGNR
jgi:5-formyltetrahydrofolate cyclo-ligase